MSEEIPEREFLDRVSEIMELDKYRKIEETMREEIRGITLFFLAIFLTMIFGWWAAFTFGLGYLVGSLGYGIYKSYRLTL